METPQQPDARAFRVALVQPPWAAGVLPGLGLSLLGAALRGRGIDARVFHWDLDLLPQMPGTTPAARYQSFSQLTSTSWFPFNEWVFSRVVHDDRLDHQEEATRR